MFDLLPESMAQIDPTPSNQSTVTTHHATEQLLHPLERRVQLSQVPQHRLLISHARRLLQRGEGCNRRRCRCLDGDVDEAEPLLIYTAKEVLS